ncbi:hypothetical protein [Mycobacterium decipiens]|nr:hypothetical protein [Mycobacterium decipiens]
MSTEDLADILTIVADERIDREVPGVEVAPTAGAADADGYVYLQLM